MNASTISTYFLNKEPRDGLSNLKLQKLLYYAQGLHLAIFGEALFDERVENWTHGPVVPSVYHQYKQYGNANISTGPALDTAAMSRQTMIFLDEVYQKFSHYTASALRNQTHRERPWQCTTTNEEISYALMQDYFEEELEGPLGEAFTASLRERNKREFREAWGEAMRGETHPISELWVGLDVE